MICLAFITEYLGAQPSIFVNEKNLIDLDTVYSQIVKRNISIYNRGSSSLRIISVGASCGCTSLHLEKDKIAPNDSTILKCEINYVKANREKIDHLYIKSNDPKNSNLELAVRAFVYKDIIVVPESLPTFSDKRLFDTVQFNISLVNMGKEDITVFEPYFSDTTHLRLVSFEPGARTIKNHCSFNYTVKAVVLEDVDGFSTFNLPCSSTTNPKFEYLVVTKTHK